MPNALLATVAGDPLRVAGVRQEVQPPCAAPRYHGYYCLTHATYLANTAQLAMHGEDGTHVIARECLACGAVEPWTPEVAHG